MAVTVPPVTPLELELEEELEEELLEELEDELDELELLDVVVEPELLEELEEELDELDEELDELEELLEDVPVPPLQFPAVGFTPLIRKLSMLARPALLLAFKLNRLFPACKVIFAEAEFPQVAQAPVPSKAKFATLLPLTNKLPERAVVPFAYTK